MPICGAQRRIAAVGGDHQRAPISLRHWPAAPLTPPAFQRHATSPRRARSVPDWLRAPPRHAARRGYGGSRRYGPAPSAPTSAASKCSEKGEAGWPGLPSVTRISRIGWAWAARCCPHPQRRQHPHTGIGQGRDPAVEFRRPARAAGGAASATTVFRPPWARARPSGRPTMPAAADHNIGLLHMLPQSCSKNSAKMRILHIFLGKSCLPVFESSDSRFSAKYHSYHNVLANRPELARFLIIR